MNLAPQLWPDSARIADNGHLWIADCDTIALAQQYGTPLYLFDAATIRAMCRSYRQAFSAAYADAGEVSIHYASKALLNTGIARLIISEGLGLDVVSGGELFVALRAGLPPERIHVHGNAKPRAELEQALQARVGQIVVDNLDELALLADLTAGLPVPQPIALRLTPGVAPDTHHHIQTGQADSKFGLPLDALDQAVQLIMGAAGLELVGLHVHLGSQIFDTQPYVRAIQVLLDCSSMLQQRFGLSIEELNLGGGIGVAYIDTQPIPNLTDYANTIGQSLRQGCAERGLPLPRLGIEPGRSIVARAGVALYSVVSRKFLAQSTDSQAASAYLHLDGGMADNLRPALYAARYTALLANRALEAAKQHVHLSGRYCESGDVLIRDLMLPEAQPGDFIALSVAGAYTLSMASNYNLTPRPAVLLLEHGQVQLLQRRETYADLVSRDA